MQIKNHKFASTYYGGLSTDAEVYNPITNDIDYFILWNPKEKPKAWNYLIDVWRVFSNLSETIDELYLTIEMLESEITDLRIKYFIKNWIIRYVSVYEISLCLINEVLELGYTGRTATKINIESDKHIKGNSILNKIRKDICNSIKGKLSLNYKKIDNLNNEIKHLGKLEINFDIDTTLLELEMNFGLIEKIDYQIKKGVVIENLKKELEHKTAEIIEEVIKLLNYLDDIYERRFNEFKN